MRELMALGEPSRTLTRAEAGVFLDDAGQGRQGGAQLLGGIHL